MGERPHDYILARVEDVRTASIHREPGYLLRKYEFGMADITQTPVAEVVGGTIEDLIRRSNGSGDADCVIWERDRVQVYNGPTFSEGLFKVISPANKKDLADFLLGQPTD
jgi:hypothetical protein